MSLPKLPPISTEYPTHDRQRWQLSKFPGPSEAAANHEAPADRTLSGSGLGLLSWVRGEIDHALSRSLELLAAFQESPDNATALAQARVQMHQAAGAIRMVGLNAVAVFADEIERQLGQLEEVAPDALTMACSVIERACRRLSTFLAEVAEGAPSIPSRLYTDYETMQRFRGIKKVTPVDLFYPNLKSGVPIAAPCVTLAGKTLSLHLVRQRRQYERGLLAWLRGDQEGAKAMRDAIARIERVTSQGDLRVFWGTVSALFEAVSERGVEGGSGIKQLAARIDLQIRRMAKSSAKVDDRLRREVLYYVAVSAPVGARVQSVQRAYQLSTLIPSAETSADDVVAMRALAREARQEIAGAKDIWLNLAEGRAEGLGNLEQTLASVHAKGTQLKHGALTKLTAALVERLGRIPSGAIPESLAMEYATALLLAESAFDNYCRLGPDFAQQVDATLARVDAACAGRPSTDRDGPMLDDITKRAQERALLTQVGHEMRENLRRIEEVLDPFFRDNSKRDELASLANDSRQIRGALRMLGLDDADRLLAQCEEQIQTYANPATEVPGEDLEMLAESLAGLGFYIDAIEQQLPDADYLIASLLDERLGEALVQAVA